MLSRYQGAYGFSRTSRALEIPPICTLGKISGFGKSREILDRRRREDLRPPSELYWHFNYLSACIESNRIPVASAWGCEFALWLRNTPRQLQAQD